MAKKTKFDKIVAESGKNANRSFGDKISPKIEREAKKDLKRKQKEREKREAMLKKPSKTGQKTSNSDAKVTKVFIKKSANVGLPTEKKDNASNIVYKDSTSINYVPETTYEEEEYNATDINNLPEYDAIISQNEQVQNSSDAEQGSLEENSDEYSYREKAIVDQKIKDNSHVSRLSADEIKSMQRQIAIERGEPFEEQNTATESKQNDKAEENGGEVNENEDNLANKQRGESSDNEDGASPPEESVSEDLTSEEIGVILNATEYGQADDDEENFEGMTDEEIAAEKERRRKLEELKQRYNAKETNDDGEDGEYKKNLDFTINTSVKRFKVKPPKKPFIIAASVLAFLMVVAGVITYLVLNRPPEPIVLDSIRVSQTTTYQYVGEELDLRGVYLTEIYSDGSTNKVQATTSMILRTSPNIDSNFNINSYSDNTFVVFIINNEEARLDISLTEVTMQSISATIYVDDVASENEISFNNILLLGQTLETGIKKLDSSLANYYISEIELDKTETGIVLPSSVSGSTTITITYTYNSQEFTTTVNINL